MNRQKEGTPLASVGEFGLIERLARAWQSAAAGSPDDSRGGGLGCLTSAIASPRLRWGIGDDAAVIDGLAGKSLLVTTDMLVEGVHFLWSPERRRLLGRKALTVNISDIAAMGGIPAWAFLSIGVPAGAAVEDVEEVYAGMGEVAARYGVVLAGGDTVRSDKWVLNVTLLGLAVKGPIGRGGGAPGDLILVTGSVGDSAAGLHLLLSAGREKAGTGMAAVSEADRKLLLSRHLDPTPRVAEAMALVEHGGVTAMMDVSDGVSSEVHHLCRNSVCGARIDVAALPIHPATRRLAEATGQDLLAWALTGGEDYELIFTAPPEQVPGLIAQVRQDAGTDVTVIGRLTEQAEGIMAVYPPETDRNVVPLAAKGYNHFR
ncbi:thiamine-phosphate kinase [Heliobacterium gestii]|uniref:Thiamine-monophosphate kinase n=1 Tax=Heliomicrobium gestii TaxID=2699 RepID=A0A845L9D7_HELGE|nr:thiamine-phosphate kinase [Heliomicrobium gestii]MBM7868159.1 thiamine-monophosphate kinase [Heliomicrobium gestii]MZP43357.1 thiamine-phosphate kinase [Heliomicrobium gestii]